MPTQALLDAVMIFLAGALLLTPGILTDLIGFSLLVPQGRRLYRQAITHWIRSRFRIHTLTSQTVGPRDKIIECHLDPRPGEPTDDDTVGD
jgi:UPF0716 protein FxsA